MSMKKLTKFVRLMPSDLQSVLSQENSKDNHVDRARSLQPSDTIDTGNIDERRGDELAALVLRGRCEDNNGERGHPKRLKRMQPH
jgi:hypothetical protein